MSDWLSVRLDHSSCGGDVALISVVMLAIYLVFTAVTVAIGLDLNGIVATLQRVTFLTAVYAMVVLALNLQWGYTGLFNIGVMGFLAVGVYTFAMLTAKAPGLGLPLPIGLLGGVIAAALVGLLVSLPALRLEADYLAIVTLAFSEIVRLLYNSKQLSSISFGGFTVGSGGAAGISFPKTNAPVRALYDGTPIGELVFGVTRPLGIQDPVVIASTYTVVLVLFVALFYLFLTRTARSPFGRVLTAIREDELVAESLGKNTQWFKIIAFMVGCGLMGLAGILWKGSAGYINPNEFLPITTFYVFIALIIGGSGSNTGSVIGAGVFAGILFYLPQLISSQADAVMGSIRDLIGGSTETPNTVIDALVGMDFTAFLAYVVANISSVRYVVIGVLLVVLMQRRPDGLLGHRIETAASVDLSERMEGEDTNSGRESDRTERDTDE